ncbi:MAG: glycosyltransferase family 2 protein [Candidatus Omnitrophica bacterium]|nr:glycosyltransferase family 2 protein [Candidatus Omnitrophota bacterium]
MAKAVEDSGQTSPDVSIILPAYNEEEAILGVIDDIHKAMAGSRYRYEVLVVDDASSDRTAQKAEEKNVRVIRRAIRQGSGASRKTGILHAQGSVIVMLDADGTYTAGDIPKMLEYFPDYDQVNGARTSEQGTMKWLRAPAKWLIRRFACYLTGTKIPDLNTGLKAFKKDIMMKYLWVMPNGFSCVTSMTLAFLVNGHRVCYLPTEYHPRIGRSKFHPVRDAANYVQTIVRMVMYFDPLKVFLPLGGLLLFAGIVKSFFSVWHTRSLQESDVIILISAVMVFAIGFLADLIVAYQKQGK